MNLARLLLPALRWDSKTGYEGMRARIERGLELGVGGFILFLGEADRVRELTEELHSRAKYPLLIASDLERGAGQQFRGATPLPPAGALGSLNDVEVTRRAGEITAYDARALGINWVYAPVADADIEPENPIIGTRAFGRTPHRTAEHVAAWIEGCRAGGALSCAKHFPGHGRTTGDSHIEKPIVTASREELEVDLEPFRAAISAGVDSMMTAHVAYPALDPECHAATLSKPILRGLLREELGYDGLIVTDAIVMDGLTENMNEAEASVAAVAAGCTMLLYPQDTEAIIRELEAALQDGRLTEARIAEALGRVEIAANKVAGPPRGVWGRERDLRWALMTAVRTLRVVRGNPALPQDPVRVIEIDDDIGGPWPAYPRSAFPAALGHAGIELANDGNPIISLYSDIRAWKGRPGISQQAQARVREVLQVHPNAPVILFGPPRLAADVPDARHVLAAWGGEALMQEASVAWLLGTTSGLPTLVAGGLDR